MKIKEHINMIIATLIKSLVLASIVTTQSFSDSEKTLYIDNFSEAIKVVLKHEGRLSNDKNDPGGITNYGISLRFIKEEHLCIDEDCNDDENEIIHLTEKEADSIYLKDWWNKYGYFRILNLQIATKVLDGSVNMGHCRAHKIVYGALNQLNKKQLPVICNLTNEAFSEINRTNSYLLHNAISDIEISFYNAIVKNNPQMNVFLKGWIARAKS